MLLDRAEVRMLFLQLLLRCKKKYAFEVMNFCIMGNHIHLMVRPAPGVSLSEIMQWQLGNFAKAYNKKRGWTGHFWGDRFHSWIIQGIGGLIRTFQYIDENPVKAGLVSNAWEWEHSGLWHDRAGIRTILGPRPAWVVPLFPAHGLLALPFPVERPFG
jgi:putative transposase